MIGKLPSGNYRVRVKFHGRVVASRTFARRNDAVRWESEQRRQLEAGQWVDPRRGDRSFEDVAHDWLKEREGRVASATLATDQHFVNHFPSDFAHFPIGQLTAPKVEAMLGRLLADGRARSSVERCAAVVSGIFVYAVKERIVGVNPCAEVKIPPGTGKPAKEVFPFTLDGLAELLELQRRYSVAGADVTEFLALTGLRWGELRALRVRDVQQAPVPAVRVSLSHPDGHDEKETKGRRKRPVPLVPVAWDIVSKRIVGRAPTAYLFTSPTGKQLHESNWKRSVRWSETANGRRVHDLRHTFATLALQGGIDVKTVQAWLGHASATLTLDLYGHFVTTDADRAGLDRLTGVLNPSGDTTGTRADAKDVRDLTKKQHLR